MNSTAQEAKTRMVAVFVVFATLAAVLLTVLVSSRNASTIDTSVGSSVSTTSAKSIDPDTCAPTDPACLAVRRGLEIINSQD